MSSEHPSDINLAPSQQEEKAHHHTTCAPTESINRPDHSKVPAVADNAEVKQQTELQHTTEQSDLSQSQQEQTPSSETTKGEGLRESSPMPRINDGNNNNNNNNNNTNDVNGSSLSAPRPSASATAAAEREEEDTLLHAANEEGEGEGQEQGHGGAEEGQHYLNSGTANDNALAEEGGSTSQSRPTSLSPPNQSNFAAMMMMGAHMQHPMQHHHGSDVETFQNLFVTKLHRNIKDQDLLALFAPYGGKSATVMLDAKTGRSKGFGFVLFDSEVDGRRAHEAMHQKQITIAGCTSQLSIFPSKHDAKNAVDPSPSLYVRNVPITVPKDDVERMLEQFGSVAFCAMREEPDGLPVWVILVEYDCQMCADNALSHLRHNTTLYPHGPLPVIAKYAKAMDRKRSLTSRKRQNASKNCPFRTARFAQGTTGNIQRIGIQSIHPQGMGMGMASPTMGMGMGAMGGPISAGGNPLIGPIANGSYTTSSFDGSYGNSVGSESLGSVWAAQMSMTQNQPGMMGSSVGGMGSSMGGSVGAMPQMGMGMHPYPHPHPHPHPQQMQMQMQMQHHPQQGGMPMTMVPMVHHGAQPGLGSASSSSSTYATGGAGAGGDLHMVPSGIGMGMGVGAGMGMGMGMGMGVPAAVPHHGVVGPMGGVVNMNNGGFAVGGGGPMHHPNGGGHGMGGGGMGMGGGGGYGPPSMVVGGPTGGAPIGGMMMGPHGAGMPMGGGGGGGGMGMGVGYQHGVGIPQMANPAMVQNHSPVGGGGGVGMSLVAGNNGNQMMGGMMPMGGGSGGMVGMGPQQQMGMGMVGSVVGPMGGMHMQQQQQYVQMQQRGGNSMAMMGGQQFIGGNAFNGGM